MKTPLPWQFEIQGQTRLNDAKLGNKINEIITYLAELTEVVEGKQDAVKYAGKIYGNGSGESITTGQDSQTGNAQNFATPTLKETLYKEGYKQALEDVRAGVPSLDYDCSAEAVKHNTCRTTVLEHLDLLGKE